jgi:MYXO-CTERM domain-containing protein
LAIDIQQYNTWRPILESHGFAWLGAGDPVHFDYVGPGAVNHTGVDVRAFQQLWNRNNPGDPIAEDGIYGPQTEARIKASPAEGFAMGADCGPTMEGPVTLALRFADAEDSYSDGPSQDAVDLLVQQLYALEIDAQNGGTEASAETTLTIELPSELLGEAYAMESDGGSGTFSPVSPPSGNPSPDGALPASFELSLGSLAPGETLRVTLSLRALEYSVESPEPLELSVSTGDAAIGILADVYSDKRWEWNGDRREGWTPAESGVTADATLSAGTLEIESTAAALAVLSPALEVATVDLVGVTLRMARSGADDLAAALVFEVDGESLRHDLELPADGEMHEVSLPADLLALPDGTIESIIVVAFDGPTDATAGLDSLRVEAVDPTTPLDPGIVGDNACGCRVVAPETKGRAAWLALALLGLGLRRRGRR